MFPLVDELKLAQEQLHLATNELKRINKDIHTIQVIIEGRLAEQERQITVMLDNCPCRGSGYVLTWGGGRERCHCYSIRAARLNRAIAAKPEK